MIRQVTEQIFLVRVNDPRGTGSTNCYLIEGKNGCTLIDTGLFSEEGTGLWKDVMSRGFRIEKIVLTHVHQDHIGLAKWFQQNFGIPVVVSNFGYEEMKQYRHPQFKDRFRQLLNNHGILRTPPHLTDFQELYDFEPDEIFKTGDRILFGSDEYETIWTPGHSYDHVCFYSWEKEIMILGDHILQHISPVIGLWNGVERNVMKEYFMSLDKIRTYPVRLGLPGHGGMIKNFSARVEEIIQNHRLRLHQVSEIIKNRDKTALEVSRELYNYDPLSRKAFLSPFMASLTRLIYLESSGRASRKTRNDLHTFQLNKEHHHTPA